MYSEVSEPHRDIEIHGRPSYNPALNDFPTCRSRTSSPKRYKEDMMESGRKSPCEDEVLAEDPLDDPIEKTLHEKDEKPLQDKLLGQIQSFITTNKICAILIGIVLFYLCNGTENDRNDCSNHLQMLKNKYPNQDPLFWGTIDYGIKDVIKNSRPSVITFLYNDTKSLEIFNATVELTKNCIPQSKEPIVLSSKELNNKNVQKDYRIIFEEYKSELLERRIMHVEDLQIISAQSSRVFHDFCDMENPIVIYFTLSYSKEDQESSRNAEELASNLLKQIWSTELDDNIASALITRVTEQTLFLKAP
ncbi:uncharacterized protein LOC129801566 [Phlebotomus papatasi]|uniref:uncharacterized protein LOC129801566 n=1 Tax=Phlebotomus papatasi TaxID=29031 RepID=UPI002483A9F1|nr:uncharacterized protein LOC129801566 [Phlebotomus papatasi]